jgi:hypothetical protein
MGDITIISSFKPEKKRTIKPAVKYCKRGTFESAQRQTEMAKAANIANPPNLGILLVCNFLSLCESYKPLSFAIVIIEGIPKRTIINEVINKSVVFNIINEIQRSIKEMIKRNLLKIFGLKLQKKGI